MAGGANDDDDVDPVDLNLNNNINGIEIPNPIPAAPVEGQRQLDYAQDVTKTAAIFLAKMKASSSTVQSTVDHVVSETSSLFSDVIGSLKAKTEQFLQGQNINDEINPKNIRLLLYVDECEIANPLGSKAGLHKIGVIYCTLLNIPPRFRSSLCNCFLITLYNAADVKQYGFDPILKPVVDDITLLEREGLYIDSEDFKGVVRVSVAQLTGDNLGVNGILGFVESFVSNHYCRHCKMHRNEMQTSPTARPNQLRNVENYEEDLHINDPGATGVKAPCLLNEIQHFHITTNYAPDVMHDLLEGVCGVEVHLVLANLIGEGLFDLDLLNSRITSFDYATTDSRNKPSSITINKLQNPDSASGQTASQMWCLIRYLPLMIGDKVPEGHQHLELLLLLLECMDFIFSPQVTTEETFFLKHLIKDHHEHFLDLFPGRTLKPKHHFMTHYPEQMRLLGPLLHYWTMRFEAKHRFFKRLGHIVCNYRNILKTLCSRQQMYLCYNIISGKDLVERDVEIGPGSIEIVASLERAEFLSRTLGIRLFEEVYVAKWSIVHGIKYCKNLLVVTGKSDYLPVFQKIIYVMVTENSSVKLITEEWLTIRYDRHTHTYVIHQPHATSWSMVSVDNLYDYYPYHASKSYNEGDQHSYVALRHRIH
ncbi:uncharacterized protein LOC114525900 [Dendronephthya gigantea]|uniref:uncharacterized protein LOC114525900 n=1 Tax=Dendronephthya gigantea TaxID=151771 RepID=UPI00106D4011|nr:uncharacterized protein LOC114525900 [Dendronephthya gigantea]